MNVLLVSSVVGLGLLAVPMWNLFSTPTLSSYSLQKNNDKILPKVSVIIPMRNEAHNVVKSLPPLLMSSYPNFEVILLDDNSSDGTFEICQKIISESDFKGRVKLMLGKTLPKGWMGKQWALHQAEQHAQGELYLFLDADVYVSKKFISCFVDWFLDGTKEVASCYPTQIQKTFGEKLLVPILWFGLYQYVPIWVVNNTKGLLSVGMGQALLLTKKFHTKIGGFEAFKDSIVDDVSLFSKAQELKASVGLIRGGKTLHCRMYHGFHDAWKGFEKNCFSVTKIPSWLFFILFHALLGLHFFVFFGPFISLSWLPLTISFVIIRIILSILSSESILFNLALYPLQVVLFYGVGMFSLWKSLFGKVEWKGRKYKIN